MHLISSFLHFDTAARGSHEPPAPAELRVPESAGPRGDSSSTCRRKGGMMMFSLRREFCKECRRAALMVTGSGTAVRCSPGSLQSTGMSSCSVIMQI